MKKQSLPNISKRIDPDVLHEREVFLREFEEWIFHNYENILVLRCRRSQLVTV